MEHWRVEVVVREVEGKRAEGKDVMEEVEAGGRSRAAGKLGKKRREQVKAFFVVCCQD